MSIHSRIPARKSGGSSTDTLGCATVAPHSSSTHLVVAKILHCVRIMTPGDYRLTSRPSSAVEQSPSIPAETSGEPTQRLEPSRKYPGALIVVEGIDGSGKSTQLYLLKRWLEIGGY